MMSPDHNNPPPVPVKPAANTTKQVENQNNGGNRKTGGSSRPQDQQQAVKCPRCDSPNTKFCYYNNYSLTQPRHFCKTCRRYWTKGGALRNVPIGGGCRKNKKMIKSFSRLSSGTDFKDEMGGLKFFHHGLNNSPAMDFQLGGLSFPRLNNPSAAGVYSQFASFDPPGISTTSNFMGFSNYPLSSGLSGAIQEMGSLNVNNGLASSIESLSTINQDLHWKLQQQRLAMLYGHEEQNQKENSNNIVSSSSVPLDQINQAQKPQHILFQNLEAASSKPDEISGVNGNPRKSNETATEWFFGNSYTPPAVTPTPTTSCSNGNGNNDNTTSNWNNGVQVQAWNHDLHHQYSTLP